jgi:cAMP-dependent protein kinase regulator
MKTPEVFEKLCKLVQDSVIYVGDDPSLVKQFVKYLVPKTVAKGEEIIRQGDEGDYFYCVESGQYDVLVSGKKVSELDNQVRSIVAMIVFHGPFAALGMFR